ncbi:S8 family serine peptidase [Coraliomargarita parva]|uniref:S8 family serine peptidase n=1 Tax=Coraliomargarita parva TaxID=3014050 RepID=UPI0022B5AD67|nr:S8 family serine peptidase [Coraliomargarita parva]
MDFPAGAKIKLTAKTATSPPALAFEGRKVSATGILVKLKEPGSDARALNALLAQQGLKVNRAFTRVAGLQLLEKGGSESSRALEPAGLVSRMKALKASGLFEYVEPDWVVQLLQSPTDTAYVDGVLWGLRNTGQNGGLPGVDINAEAAWGLTTGEPAVVVGVIDTGVRYTHQDLIHNMWVNSGEIPGNGTDDDGNGYVDDIYGINAITGSGNPMDDHDHGSHVAGTIAASANDAGPHVGVAYHVQLMALKFMSASGTGNISDAITCIEYAIEQDVDILSNSWGGGGYSQAMFDAISAANDAGILFVAASGNSGLNNDILPHYPSSYEVDNVVAVAAIDRTGALAGFSNYGVSSVDIAAPGVDIYSCISSSDTAYASYSGTSMATPHVAGVAALLVSEFPAAGVAELKNRLFSAAAPLGSLSGRIGTGGMVDAYAALQLAEDGVLELQASTDGPLPEGEAAKFYVTVTDLIPVTGATVTGDLDGGAAQSFHDDGVAPDAVANDAVYTASLPVPTGVNSTALNVFASAPGKTSASGSFIFPVLAPPPNDDFANRIVLAPGTTQASGSNILASLEADEPLNPDVAGGKTVWWEWTAATTGTATITTEGSAYDTTLAIYDGDALASLSLIAENDDQNLFSLQSAVSFPAVAGQAYLIQVDGYEGEAGAIQLTYPVAGGGEGPPQILNQPEGLTSAVGYAFSLSVLAIGDVPLQYEWRLDGVPISGATSATYSVASASLSDEGSYTVLVSNAEGSVLSDPAEVQVLEAGEAPFNDLFANALTLSGVEGQVGGSNLGAGGESGEPDHASASQPIESVWYQWTAPENGTLQVATIGSDFDTTLAGYSGTAVNDLAEIASNDDFFGTESIIEMPVVAGTTYHIAVDGFAAEKGQIVLTYSMVVAPPAPGNDNFSDRLDLGSGSVSTTGTNAGASGESGEPDHAANSSPLASVWWSWTPLVSGNVTISTEGSSFDTTMGVYTGTSVDTLTEIASNDDWDFDLGYYHSEVSFSVEPGTSYQIAVDGYDVLEGSIVLAILFSPEGNPEIVVELSGSELTDGLDTADFGSVALGSSLSRTFSVSNTGDLALMGLSLSLVGANAGDYAASPLPASLEPGGSFNFTLSFTPTAGGVRAAAFQIANNDSDENPFDVGLTGTSGSAAELFLNAAAEAGLSDVDKSAEGTPFDDGVSNLLKYAFNMNLGEADSTRMVSGGTAGLPLYSLIPEGEGMVWQMEYIRRRGAGLVYTPMRSNSLEAGSFYPIVGTTESVTTIDDFWERVVIDEVIDPEINPFGFGYIDVSLP